MKPNDQQLLEEAYKSVNNLKRSLKITGKLGSDDERIESSDDSMDRDIKQTVASMLRSEPGVDYGKDVGYGPSHDYTIQNLRFNPKTLELEGTHYEKGNFKCVLVNIDENNIQIVQ